MKRVLSMALALVLMLGAAVLSADSHITVSAAESAWLWPVPSSTSTSRGYSNAHTALDITAAWNAPIVASKSGTVVLAYTGCNNTNGYYSSCTGKGTCAPNTANYWNGCCNYGYGNGVVIDHGDGTFSSYGHMSGISVYYGQYVSQGQQIGNMGSAGYSTGCHLDFWIGYDRWGNSRINNNVGVIGYIYSTVPQTPSISLEPSHSYYSVGETNAVLCAYIHNPNHGTIGDVGLYLYDGAGNLLLTHVEACNPSYTTYDPVFGWFNLNVDAGYSLQPGTAYSYVVYAYINGTEYKSEKATFTTGGQSPSVNGSGSLTTLLGDVDQNQKINTTDARLTLQYAAGRIGSDALSLSAADVDKNQKVNTTDARLILQCAAQRIPMFS